MTQYLGFAFNYFRTNSSVTPLGIQGRMCTMVGSKGWVDGGSWLLLSCTDEISRRCLRHSIVTFMLPSGLALLWAVQGQKKNRSSISTAPPTVRAVLGLCWGFLACQAPLGSDVGDSWDEQMCRKWLLWESWGRFHFVFVWFVSFCFWGSLQLGFPTYRSLNVSQGGKVFLC